MAKDDIKVKDIFKKDDLTTLENKVDEILERFAIHDHDGRNSLEIDTLKNQRKLILATLSQLSDKSDGNVEITGTTTLTRDMFYDRLTIKNGGILQPDGFRIFADIVEIKAGGIIRRNGNVGSNGTDAVGATIGDGGAGGAALASGSLPAGEDGKVGGDGGTQSGLLESRTGDDGVAGDDVAKSIGVAGVGGGGGGNGGAGDGGGNGGAGGAQTGTVFNVPRSFASAYILADSDFSGGSMIPLGGTAGSGSGGGGGGGQSVGSGSGGGGGGSGSPGGMVSIFAKQIINNGTIESKAGGGGDGGAGADGVSGDGQGGGGGGGGAGGSGGAILLVYGDLSGSGVTDVTGGTGGTGGALGTGVGSGANGVVGSNGTNGSDSSFFSIQISSL